MEMSVNRISKIIGKRLLYVLAGAVLFLCLKMPAWATETENKDVMTLQQVIQDTGIKEYASEDAAVLLNLPIGTGVIVHGEPEDSWSRVEYAGVEGYIESSLLIPYNAAGIESDTVAADGADGTDTLSQEMQEFEDEAFRTLDEHELAQKAYNAAEVESDSTAIDGADGTDGLAHEMQVFEDEAFRILDEYELAQKSKRSSIIWGIIIVVLVITIFIIGIISALKNSKNDSEDDSEDEHYSDEEYEDKEDDDEYYYDEDYDDIEYEEIEDEDDDLEEIDL